VARLGRRQRGPHRLLVTHLTDQDHVRVLAQHALQGRLERQRVLTHLALVDDRVLVAVEELDRVLDRDDVLVVMGVHPVDHRRERRGLPGAGRSGHEDDPALLVGEVVDRLREVQLLDRLDVGRDRPEDERDRAALVEGVHAEAAGAVHAEREVELALALELLALGVVGDHRVEDVVGVVRQQLVRVRDRLQAAVDADQRRRGHLQVQVGPTRLDDALQRSF
jgi:hypothetical protein